MSIAVEGATKRFGAFTALDNVTIEVPDGALTALLGPSGSGKSTLLRVIAGLERPDIGQVMIGGRDVTRVPVEERGVGFVFQHYAAFKHMTVRGNVAFGLQVRKRPKAEVAARVDELLRLVHLEGFARRYPAQLSGGQRQRMALARALAVEPRVLLLDEPFGALDATVRKELREWLRRLHDEVHVTTIFVTHDQEEAMDVAEEIVVMREGHVEQAGSPVDLYEHPETEFVMGFVGEVNRRGALFIRPHDVELSHLREAGAEEAMIERIVHLGFEVRVALLLADGDRLWAQLSRAQAQELELTQGQIVYARPSRARVFDEEGEPSTAELAASARPGAPTAGAPALADSRRRCRRGSRTPAPGARLPAGPATRPGAAWPRRCTTGSRALRHERSRAAPRRRGSPRRS
jgi:sulfate transport system ATP-binding protein